MSRRTLIQKNNRLNRFDKYLLRRRSTQNRMSAHTPVRFLRRLGLLSDLELGSRTQFTFEQLPDDWTPLISPPPVPETVSGDMFDLQTSSDSAPAAEIGAIAQTVVNDERSAEQGQVGEENQRVSNVERPIVTPPPNAQRVRSGQEASQKTVAPAPTIPLPPVTRKLTSKPTATVATSTKSVVAKASDRATKVSSQQPTASLPTIHRFSPAEQEIDVDESARQISAEEPQMISVPQPSTGVVEQIEASGSSSEPIVATGSDNRSEHSPVLPISADNLGRFSQDDKHHLPVSLQDAQGPASVAAAHKVTSEAFRVTSLRETALENPDPESHNNGSTEAVLEPAATEEFIRTAPADVASNATEQSVPKTQSEHTEARVAPVAESLLESDTKSGATAALLPRRARIEEIANEAQPTNRSSTDKSMLSKPGIDTPSAYVASKQKAMKGLDVSKPQRPQPAEGLFTQKTDVDRSPAAWVEKLRQAFNPSAKHNRQPDNRAETIPVGDKTELVRRNLSNPTAGPRRLPPAPATEAPAEVPGTTRRFLKPLLGIDPATVPIFEGPIASQFATANQADGFALSETVILKSAPVAETPERLGLLAHELTHIARQRKPRFVPPVVRQQQHSLTATPAPEDLDEEALARRVEAQVIDIASGATEVPVIAETPVTTVDTGTQGSELVPMGNAPPAELAPNGDDSAEPWGGLPAPWEPLPEWVVALSEGSAAAPPTSAPVLPSVATMGSVPMERAEEGRVLNHPAASPAAVAAEPKKSAAPDLDALARQVYLVLKRRLETEYRRSI